MGGRVVGIAFQALAGGDSVGYIIPTPVMAHFLDDLARHGGRYTGASRALSPPPPQQHYSPPQQHRAAPCAAAPSAAHCFSRCAHHAAHSAAQKRMRQLFSHRTLNPLPPPSQRPNPEPCRRCRPLPPKTAHNQNKPSRQASATWVRTTRRWRMRDSRLLWQCRPAWRVAGGRGRGGGLCCWRPPRISRTRSLPRRPPLTSPSPPQPARIQKHANVAYIQPYNRRASTSPNSSRWPTRRPR